MADNSRISENNFLYKVIVESKIFKMLVPLLLIVVSVTISIPTLNCVPVSESGGDPTVCITDGCIQGKVMLEEAYEAFLGIPFAEPPLQHLRFSVS